MCHMFLLENTNTNQGILTSTKDQDGMTVIQKMTHELNTTRNVSTNADGTTVPAINSATTIALTVTISTLAITPILL